MGALLVHGSLWRAASERLAQSEADEGSVCDRSHLLPYAFPDFEWEGDWQVDLLALGDKVSSSRLIRITVAQFRAAGATR